MQEIFWDKRSQKQHESAQVLDTCNEDTSFLAVSWDSADPKDVNLYQKKIK